MVQVFLFSLIRSICTQVLCLWLILITRACYKNQCKWILLWKFLMLNTNLSSKFFYHVKCLFNKKLKPILTILTAYELLNLCYIEISVNDFIRFFNAEHWFVSKLYQNIILSEQVCNLCRFMQARLGSVAQINPSLLI